MVGVYSMPAGSRSSLPVRYVSPPTTARQVSVPGGQQQYPPHLYGVMVPMTKFRRAVGDGATPVIRPGAHTARCPQSRSLATATGSITR